MNTSEVLYRAADLIEERGWGQGDGIIPPADGLCIVTAFSHAGATSESDAFRRATDAVRQHLSGGDRGHVAPIDWNDDPDRTAAEVIEVLRAAAVIEAARESENAAYCA